MTYPTFFFDYPDGWTVTSEEVTSSSEEVVLTNDRGATVTYWHFGGMRELTGRVRIYNRVDVTYAANANFQPGYVQATNYSDLGTFMVAKLKNTSTCDMDADGEFFELENGSVRYALLPESKTGEQMEEIIVGLPTFTFWYSGHISLIANAPDGAFTEQEEKEVIAILSSFRETPDLTNPVEVLPTPTDNNTVATIDDLWAMLKGTWTFEEYTYDGKDDSVGFEHFLEFSYINKIPCMKRSYPDKVYPDILFYEFSPIDEYRYNAYTYKIDSYGGEDGGNVSDDVLLIWYTFDLSNFSNGELLIEYHMSFANGFVDNYHLFRYSQN
ncbi:hypothetical protein D1641_12015 [Colidextribacter sp. OB.20]|nr:hypothetical protein [Colidextribacter sp. OB.20]